MNQSIKDAVYGLGTQKHVDYLAALGGMNDTERKIFQLIHEGRTDLYIQEEIGLSKTAYARIEDHMRSKLMVAIFDCINYRMLTT